MMHLEIILTLSGICFIAYYSLQPKMVFEGWLLYWAKRILDKEKINYSTTVFLNKKGDRFYNVKKQYQRFYKIKVEYMDSEAILDLAMDYNKWIKPLGYCSKCFAPWFLFPFALSVYLATEIPFEQIVYIYVTSIIITIWLAVKV